MAILFSHVGVIDGLPSKLSLDINGISLYYCLNWAANSYGASLEQVVTCDGELSKELVILVNGVSIDKLNGLSTVINDGDKILLTGLISGG